VGFAHFFWYGPILPARSFVAWQGMLLQDDKKDGILLNFMRERKSDWVLV
jgi:hypothetical protein